MNCTPCGALPWLASSTLTRPPFAVFGAWQATDLPFSPILSESVVGLLLPLSLPPHPAIAAAVPIIAARNATPLRICTSTRHRPLCLLHPPTETRGSLAHSASRRRPESSLWPPDV